MRLLKAGIERNKGHLLPNPLISWRSIGRPQQTLASSVARTGVALHSGARTTAAILPAAAGEGRFFVADDVHGGCRRRILASAGSVSDSRLCTTLSNGGATVRTVEHLLSALDALGVDNCRIEISGGGEVPLLDGSSREWVEAIEEAGLCAAEDSTGHPVDKLAPFVVDPVHVWKNGSFICAFPSSKPQITCGIDFSHVPVIGRSWFSCFPLDPSVFKKHIAPSRTFCVYEEVDKMRKAGLIKGGSAKNAIICSVSEGWLNPPLRFFEEPCRHKVLDLIGDLSLFAHGGSQGLPVAHIIAFKGGHSLHVEFVERLMGMYNTTDSVNYPRKLQPLSSNVEMSSKYNVVSRQSDV